MLRFAMLKQISSEVDTSPNSNQAIADDVYANFKDDEYFSDAGLLPEHIRTIGFIKYSRNNLEMLQSVEAVPRLLRGGHGGWWLNFAMETIETMVGTAKRI